MTLLTTHHRCLFLLYPSVNSRFWTATSRSIKFTTASIQVIFVPQHSFLCEGLVDRRKARIKWKQGEITWKSCQDGLLRFTPSEDATLREGAGLQWWVNDQSVYLCVYVCPLGFSPPLFYLGLSAVEVVETEDVSNRTNKLFHVMAV